MPQYISQDLFDRMALALVLNSDPRLSDPRTAEEVGQLLKDGRRSFPDDDFTSDLFKAVRWFRDWCKVALEFDGDLTFLTTQQINERCRTHYPSGFHRPVHQSDVQPLAHREGERVVTFQSNMVSYLGQLDWAA